jgi:hypothetical protein
VIVKDTRLSSDLKNIMLHHSEQTSSPKGVDSNKGYNASGQFGIPYDIVVNSDGSYDLSSRWIYGSNQNQFLQNAQLTTITKYNKHYLAGIGDTYVQTKNYIHIVLSGNFDITKPTLFQINALISLLNTLTSFYQIDPRSNLYYHNDVARTSCPGLNMLPKWSLIPLLSLNLQYDLVIQKDSVDAIYDPIILNFTDSNTAVSLDNDTVTVTYTF